MAYNKRTGDGDKSKRAWMTAVTTDVQIGEGDGESGVGGDGGDKWLMSSALSSSWTKSSDEEDAFTSQR